MLLPPPEKNKKSTSFCLIISHHDVNLNSYKGTKKISEYRVNYYKLKGGKE